MRLFIVFLFLLFISCKKEINQTGVLRVVGNAPFTQLVFTSENIDYQLPSAIREKYSHQQNKKVRIKGNVSVREMKTVGGEYTLEIYELEPDSIIILE